MSWTITTTRDPDAAAPASLEAIVETKRGFLPRLRRAVRTLVFPLLLAGAVTLGGARRATAQTLPSLSAVEAVVPAANTPGFNGSYWTTNLKALDTGSDIATYTIYAVPNGSAYPDGVLASLARTLSPGQSENLENVLAQMGLDHFSGALFLDTTEGDVAYFSRTQNSLANGSVVGQGVPPLQQADAASPNGISGAYAWMPLTGRMDENGKPITWRTNADVMAWAAGTINYGLVADDGSFVAQDALVLPAGQLVQLNKVVEQHANPRMIHEDLRGILLWTTDGTPFSAGESIIDNRGAQDPTWFTATTQPLADAFAVGVSWSGANNSYWKTDTWAHNKGTQARSLSYQYTFVSKSGAHGSVTKGYALDAGHTLQETDIAANRLESPDTAGTIEFGATADTQFAERVYSEAPDGSTAGQAIRPLPPEEALDPGSVGYAYGLTVDENSRVAVGFVNAATNDQLPAKTTLELIVKDGTTGEVLKDETLTLDEKEWLQIDNIFQGVYTGQNGLLEVRVLDIAGDDQYDSGGVIAYASTVANEPALAPAEKHNDPSYQSFTKRSLGPNQAPTMNDCLEDVTLSPPAEFCGAQDGDYTIDGLIGPSARGPPPGGPNLYHWGATDAQGDPMTFNVRFVDLKNGQPWNPPYITVTKNAESIDLNIDPDDGDIGDHFDMYVQTCDALACSPEYTATFTIVP